MADCRIGYQVDNPTYIPHREYIFDGRKCINRGPFTPRRRHELFIHPQPQFTSSSTIKGPLYNPLFLTHFMATLYTKCDIYYPSSSRYSVPLLHSPTVA